MKRHKSGFGGIVVAAVAAAPLLAAGNAGAWSAESEASLRAGLAKVDITPDLPVKMSGYAGREGLSEGVHDRLYARVTALESGGDRLVLVSTDLIGYYQTYEPIRDAICDRFDLKPCEILLTGIHTHSAPTPTLDEDGHPTTASTRRA